MARKTKWRPFPNWKVEKPSDALQVSKICPVPALRLPKIIVMVSQSADRVEAIGLDHS